MNKHQLSFALFFVLLLGGCSKKYDVSKIQLEQGVYDGVGVMAPDQYATLKNEIQNLEKNVGSQIGIVIIDTLNGSDFNETSSAIAKKLKLGRKEYEDGVLIFVSTGDRKISIEAGRGLEKILDSETRNRIITDKITYRFNRREYFQCLYIAVLEINQLIDANRQLVGKFP